MFDLEKINDTCHQILVLAQEQDKDTFLHQVVEIIAKRLGIYFVAIYLSDEKGKFIHFKAGNGEIGQRLQKHRHKIKISESKNLYNQAGTAVCRNEIRLASIETGNILAWKISMDGIIATQISDQVEIFVGSPILPSSLTELSLPFQTNGKIIGVLEISLDVRPDFSKDEILKLQEMANEMALYLI